MQTVIVLLIVAAALAYLGLRGWRALAAGRRADDDAACGSGCGCAPRGARPNAEPARKRARR